MNAMNPPQGSTLHWRAIKLNFVIIWLACWLLTPGAQGATTRPATLNSPEGVLWQFDSLMSSSHPEAARNLVVGEALRMFDLLLLSNQKVMPYVDTIRSHDTLLEKQQKGGRASLKVLGTLVFKQTFMGMDSLTSVQVMHCLAAPQGWRIAAFTELDKPTTPMEILSSQDSAAQLSMPSPTRSQNGMAQPGFNSGYFPASSRMLPASLSRETPTQMRMRLTLRQPQIIPNWLKGGGNQRILKTQTLGEAEIEVSRLTLAQLKKAMALPQSNNQSAYLATTEYVDLTDTALQALSNQLARSLSKKAKPASPAFALEYTQAVYAYLSQHFEFQLGAALFGTSRESLSRMRGDCSECAMLTTALLRAKGVPSRLAIGFASVGGGSFIGHAWCEAWLGEWVGVDAALKEFPTGVQRARLLNHDGSGDVRVAATNLVLKVVNNLDIEILSAHQGNKPIPLVQSSQDASAGRRFFEQVLSGMGP